MHIQCQRPETLCLLIKAWPAALRVLSQEWLERSVLQGGWELLG